MIIVETSTQASRRAAIALRHILLVLSLLLAGPLFMAAQADLTGFWVLRVPTGDGNYRETFFDLKQSGDAVTGKVLQGARELPISEGTFKGGRLHLERALAEGQLPSTLQDLAGYG